MRIGPRILCASYAPERPGGSAPSTPRRSNITIVECHNWYPMVRWSGERNVVIKFFRSVNSLELNRITIPPGAAVRFGLSEMLIEGNEYFLVAEHETGEMERLTFIHNGHLHPPTIVAEPAEAAPKTLATRETVRVVDGAGRHIGTMAVTHPGGDPDAFLFRAISTSAPRGAAPAPQVTRATLATQPAPIPATQKPKLTMTEKRAAREKARERKAAAKAHRIPQQNRNRISPLVNRTADDTTRQAMPTQPAAPKPRGFWAWLLNIAARKP